MKTEKYKQKRKLILLGIFVLVCLILFVGVMIKMITENGKCIDNPFQYSAQKLKDSGGEYLCSCQSTSPELLDFTFDEEGIHIIDPTENYFNPNKIK